MAVESDFLDKLPPVIQYIGWAVGGLASLGFWLMGRRKSDSITPQAATLSQADVLTAQLDNEKLRQDIMKIMEVRREATDQVFAQQMSAFNRQYEALTQRLNNHAERLRLLELKAASRR